MNGKKNQHSQEDLHRPYLNSASRTYGTVANPQWLG
jgi:hypothetical protein